MSIDRLGSQLRFIVEVDKIKDVYRQTLLMNGSRKENDAEHSWHLAVMAVLLKEYAAELLDRFGLGDRMERNLYGLLETLIAAKEYLTGLQDGRDGNGV